MERFQVEVAATTLEISIAESWRRFDRWVKRPNPRGTQDNSISRSQAHSVTRDSQIDSESKPNLPHQHPSSSVGVRRPLLPRNPHIEHLSKELRRAEEQNAALRKDIARVQSTNEALERELEPLRPLKEDIAHAHSAKEALERELEPLRAFHQKWSQHDLEALLSAEKRVAEESAIRVKAEERHDTFREPEQKLSTFNESYQALKTERDGTSSMTFKK